MDNTTCDATLKPIDVDCMLHADPNRLRDIRRIQRLYAAHVTWLNKYGRITAIFVVTYCSAKGKNGGTMIRTHGLQCTEKICFLRDGNRRGASANFVKAHVDLLH